MSIKCDKKSPFKTRSAKCTSSWIIERKHLSKCMSYKVSSAPFHSAHEPLPSQEPVQPIPSTDKLQ